MPDYYDKNQFTGGRTPPPKPPKKNGGEGGWISWPIIIVLFAIGAWPFALVLMFFNIFGGEAKKAAPGAAAKAQEAAAKAQAAAEQAAARAREAAQAAHAAGPRKSAAQESMEKARAARNGQPGHITDPEALDRDGVLILDSAVAHGNYRVASQRGARLPLHCTSQGKLLLAYLPPQRRRALLRTCRFEDYTPHSHRSAEALEEDLAQIRERGFALENGEFRIGLRSVSAPVFDVEGQAAYALCAVGMFRRMDAPELERATHLVRDAARRISFDLGYRGGLSHA